MITDRVIVSETSGRWAFALRSILGNSGVVVVEFGDLSKAFDKFWEDSRSLLAFEASATDAEEGFGLLAMGRQRGTGRRVIVLLDDTTVDSESIWYEAGAAAVVASPRRLAPLADLIQRHFETQENAPLTFYESVGRRMPWNDSETQT